MLLHTCWLAINLSFFYFLKLLYYISATRGVSVKLKQKVLKLQADRCCSVFSYSFFSPPKWSVQSDRFETTEGTLFVFWQVDAESSAG